MYMLRHITVDRLWCVQTTTILFLMISGLPWHIFSSLSEAFSKVSHCPTDHEPPQLQPEYHTVLPTKNHLNSNLSFTFPPLQTMTPSSDSPVNPVIIRPGQTFTSQSSYPILFAFLKLSGDQSSKLPLLKSPSYQSSS